MSKIQILGPGCQKCIALHDRVRQVVQELGLTCEIEKVTDLEAIIGFGVMATPTLVVDGVVRVSGRVPSVPQLKEILS
jgi:small redox-active disulfide protein 2